MRAAFFPCANYTPDSSGFHRCIHIHRKTSTASSARVTFYDAVFNRHALLVFQQADERRKHLLRRRRVLLRKKTVSIHPLHLPGGI